MNYLFFFFILFTALSRSYAAEPVPSASATCIGCHGPAGISMNPLWPNLAGQKSEYLLKQLIDFREGRRNDPLMSAIAKTIAESDLKSLAHYFSTLHN